MAVNGNGYLNFVDNSTVKVKGQYAPITKLLAQRNEWMRRARFQEANNGTFEEVVIQTSLPDAYYVTVGKGVPISKATHAKLQEGWAIIEQSTEVPRHLARGAELQRIREIQGNAAVEAVGQKGSQGFIYANGAINDDQFNGLAVRLASLNGGNAQQLFNCTGATANQQTSIYAVKWMENGCYVVTPPGMMAGVSEEDLGITSRTDASGVIDLWRSVVNLGIGLAVPDYRCIGRICNIDVPSLRAVSGTQAATATTNVLHGILYMIGRMNRLGAGPIVFHANMDVFTALTRIGMDKSQNAVLLQQGAGQFGEPGAVEMTVHGHPLVLMDQILSTEAIVA